MELVAADNEAQPPALPPGWRTMSLADISDPKRPICYGIVQVGQYDREGVPVVAIKDMHGSYGSELHRSSDQIESQYVRSRVGPGDVLISVKGTAGKIGLVPNHFTGNISRDIARVSLFEGQVPEFWFQMLKSDLARARLEAATVGTTRLELSIGTLKKVRLPVPPPEEQRAIAAALSEVDDLLAALDALIEKKRAVKTAAMQRLLKGRQRLPGFSGEWETKRLNEVAEIIGGGTPKSTVPLYWDGGIRWCTPTDITSCSGKYLDTTERTISDLGLKSSAARLLPAGALLLCTRATLGEVRIAIEPTATNQGFQSLVCGPSVDNEYLYYLVATLKPAMAAKASGSTFLEISRGGVASLEVNLPPLEEQQAIVAILSDMDAEIAALQARREKTCMIKQGMMQELLTGRTRLV